MATTKTLDELYKGQQQVADAEYQANKIIAEQAATNKRMSINQQLAKQRQDFGASSQQIQEQAYMGNRNLSNQLSRRGLGSSGLQQVAQLQNKMASDRSLSQLYGVNADVSKAGVQALQGTEQDLSNALRQSSLDYQKNQQGLNDTMYNRQQGEKSQNLQLAQMLFEASMAEGMTPEKLGQLQDTITAFTSNKEEGTPGSLTDLIKGGTLSNSPDNILGDKEFKGKYTTISALSPGVRKATFKYNVPGLGKVNFRNKQEVEDAYKNLYKDREYASKINVEREELTGDIFFVVGGKKFRTYNKAENYFKLLNK